MSASREKKQRQISGPDQKTAQVRQEQADHKRKVYGYTAIGVVVAVLVAALLIWNSGFFQRRATAVTVGDEDISVAELSYYYYNARYMYAAYGMLDASLPDNEQYYDEEAGTTYRDFFLETALDDITRYTALYNAAIEAGYSLDDVQDELKQAIDTAKASASSSGYSYTSYLRALFGKYMTAGVYQELEGKRLLISRFNSDRTKELSSSYSQQELDAYYTEHAEDLDTFEYSYLQLAADEVSIQDEEGNALDEDTIAQQTEQAMESARAKAEQAQTEYEDGATVAELIEAYEPSSSGDHTSVVGSTGISSSYKDDLIALEDGQSAIVESDNGYYLVILHSRYLAEEPTVDVRHILLYAETTQDENGQTVPPTEEAWNAAREKMQSILDEYEAGDRTEESFAALANQYSDDPGSNTNGGLYEGGNSFVPEFESWVFADGRQSGDVSGIIQHMPGEDDSNPYWGYHLIYYVNANEFSWQVTVRSTMAGEALEEWSDEEQANYETVLADGANYLGF